MILFLFLVIDSQNSQVIAAEMDMVSALQTRKGFLEKQLIEKRELLNMLCLREAVRILFVINSIIQLNLSKSLYETNSICPWKGLNRCAG